MSDDDERRRPDETSEFLPFGDESEVPSNGGPRTGDATTQVRRPAADPDRTSIFPTPDEDATRVTPVGRQSDATSVLPSAADDGTRTQRYPRSTDNWADDREPVWSARAGVRTPKYNDDSTDTDWAAVPADEPRGRWWTPIAVGIVALLLLGVLGWGLYLIVQSSRDGDGDGAPAVTASPAAPDPTTTEPTSKPPSTTRTTTQPTSSPTPSPSDVTVPALKGLSSEEARAALDRKRLNYRLRFVTSDSPAGTVIDSDPSEGQQVPADTVITLIIAGQPGTPRTPTQTPTATTPAGQQPDDD